MTRTSYWSFPRHRHPPCWRAEIEPRERQTATCDWWSVATLALHARTSRERAKMCSSSGCISRCNLRQMSNHNTDFRPHSVGSSILFHPSAVSAPCKWGCSFQVSGLSPWKDKQHPLNNGGGRALLPLLPLANPVSSLQGILGSERAPARVWGQQHGGSFELLQEMRSFR